jgi:hypothetical protein
MNGRDLDPQFDPEDLEELPQTYEIDLTLYSHEIFIAGQVSFTIGQEKYYFVKTEGESAYQQVIFVLEIVNLAIVDEFLVDHAFCQFMHQFLGDFLMLDNVPVHPEKVERPYRSFKTFFRQHVMEIFHTTTHSGGIH